MDSSEVVSGSDEDDMTDTQEYKQYRQALFLSVAALQHTAQTLTQEFETNEKIPNRDRGLEKDVMCSESTCQAGSLSGIELWSLRALEGSAQAQHLEHYPALHRSKGQGQHITVSQQELVCSSEHAKWKTARQQAEPSRAETETGSASVASAEWPLQVHQATKVVFDRKSSSKPRQRTPAATKSEVRSRQKSLGPAHASKHTRAGLSYSGDGSPKRPSEPVDELAAALEQSRADQEELLAEVAASRALCAELALQRAQHTIRAAAIEEERQRRQAELQVVAATQAIAAGIVSLQSR